MAAHVTEPHRIFAVLYRQYPAALTVEGVSAGAGCTSSAAEAVLDRLWRARLIEHQWSSTGEATYVASTSARNEA